MKSMNDLFLQSLQDIYYAEKQGLRGLQKIAKAVESQALKDALLNHREQSQHQVERLEQVFVQLGKRPRGKTCQAMNGLMAEGEEEIAEGEKGAVLDAALIAAGQSIEHYEIARYGSLLAWAKALGMNEAGALLQQTLEEEKQSDALLSEIAERALNQQAAEENGGEEAGGEEDEGTKNDGKVKARSRPKPKARTAAKK
ncbi:MAG: ferritin-like domain-containing protein [Acetobacteraceae bacterium]|nr:ferritin-like domain-containing protein [Acetobacteraceae bacterium]